MTGCVANIIQIIVLTARSDTFLGSSCTAIGALIKAQKNVLKLVHPGIGKEQGRVIPRYHGAGRDDLVAILGEVVQVRLANLGDFHGNNYRIGTCRGQNLCNPSQICLTIPQHQ